MCIGNGAPVGLTGNGSYLPTVGMETGVVQVEPGSAVDRWRAMVYVCCVAVGLIFDGGGPRQQIWPAAFILLHSHRAISRPLRTTGMSKGMGYSLTLFGVPHVDKGNITFACRDLASTYSGPCRSRIRTVPGWNEETRSDLA